MRLKKVLFVISITFSLRVLSSCCDCPPTSEFQYSFDYISVYNLDNSGKESVISQTNVIPKEAYGILIDFSLLKISLNSFHLKGFSEANAFDCFCPPETRYTPKDTITSIVIISNNVFDNQHPAESNISDLFKILGSDNYISIQEYLKKSEKIYEYNKPENEKINLFLLQPPSSAGDFRFTVEVHLSDNRILSMIANPVTLE